MESKTRTSAADGNSLKFVPVIVLALLASMAGCKNEQPLESAAANGNLAPVSDSGAAAPAPPSQPQQYPAQPQQGAEAQYQPAADSSQYGEEGDIDQVSEYAPDPPPPLPEYQQPPCPEPNYLWTPGYWSYAPTGYYWVPGAWAAAPYTGALWTPGYWGYVSGRYGWHRGYWGRYIGYYGGVNYGNGYVGRGYWGGYWNRNQFAYNRRVTNVNTTIIHNTYITNVTNITTYNRVSYAGGRGGVNLPATPAELAAIRQPRLPPLRVQQEARQQAGTNRAQFAAENHGRPQTLVMERPLTVERREPAPPAAQRPVNHEPVNQQKPGLQAHPVPEPQPASHMQKPVSPEPRPGEPKAATREQTRAPQPERPPAPQQKTPEPKSAPKERPRQPQPESRPAAQPKTPESMPAHQQHLAPEPRVQEAPRPEQGRPQKDNPHPEEHPHG